MRRRTVRPSSFAVARSLMMLLVLATTSSFLGVQAFTGTYGINYGRIADNILSPDEVVKLLRAAKIKNVRIYDADHSVLNAFSGTGLELVVGLGNEHLEDMSANPDHALNWVEQNVQAFIPGTHIVGIAIGNEVLGGNDQELYGFLLGAAKNVYHALQKLQLANVVQITTAHSQNVFANSYPPSSCVFKDNIVQYMKPLLQFLSQIGSPFCLNAYPFLAYMYNTQIDAAYAALEDAGFNKMEVIITETGWASLGDQNEAAATVNNARTYNHNLRKRLAKKKGTPRRPDFVLKAYIFAVFNENLKPGPTSERNFGLFKPDGSISYDIGLLKSSAEASLLHFKDIKASGLLGSILVSILFMGCTTLADFFLR